MIGLCVQLYAEVVKEPEQEDVEVHHLTVAQDPKSKSGPVTQNHAQVFYKADIFIALI